MAEHKKKRKPHKIITTKAEDGTYGHEHVYHGDDRPVFAGTSQDTNDIKQHMEDHFGEEATPAAAPAEPAAAAAAGGGGDNEGVG